MIPRDTLKRLSNRVSEQLEDAKYTIVILEGFLLYHRPDVRSRLDGRLFVRLDHKEARRRRLTRPFYGAEAKEGEFWKTDHYFEKMVRRNYVEQHADLLEGGNVEGSVDMGVCGERGIAMQEAMNVEVGQMLDWAVDVMIGLLKAHSGQPLGQFVHCSVHLTWIADTETSQRGSLFTGPVLILQLGSSLLF